MFGGGYSTILIFGTPWAVAVKRAVKRKPEQTIPTAGIPACSVQAVARATAGSHVPQPPAATITTSTPASLATSPQVPSVDSVPQGSVIPLGSLINCEPLICLPKRSDRASNKTSLQSNPVQTSPIFFPSKLDGRGEIGASLQDGMPRGLTASYTSFSDNNGKLINSPLFTYCNVKISLDKVRKNPPKMLKNSGMKRLCPIYKSFKFGHLKKVAKEEF
jgi:hypothetical protein